MGQQELRQPVLRGARALLRPQHADGLQRRDALAGGSGQLRVTLDHDYCWMWTNKGSAPVSLTVDLAR